MIERPSTAKVLLTPLILVTTFVLLLAACGMIGWILSAVFGLSLAQGITISTAAFAANVLVLSRSTGLSINMLLLIGVSIAAALSIVSGLFGLLVDWWTPLTRWESCLFVFVVSTSLVLLYVNQAVEAMNLFSFFESVEDDDFEQLPPVHPRPSRRRRRRNS